MPWQLKAMKDVVTCDKLRGASKQALIRRSPNGKTCPVEDGASYAEYIGIGSKLRELKHLST